MFVEQLLALPGSAYNLAMKFVHLASPFLSLVAVLSWGHHGDMGHPEDKVALSSWWISLRGVRVEFPLVSEQMLVIMGIVNMN